MKRLLFLLLLIDFRQGIGQTFVLIPDVNFRTYLQSIVPSAISGNSLDITHTLVTTSTKTMLVGANTISDLTGVQYFTSLLRLDCANNSLTSLPSLPNSLLTLICYGNSLTSLPTLPASLQSLSCYSNSLTALPILPNSLTELGCDNNSLTSLPSLPNTILNLSCGNNLLTNIPTLPNSLKTLNCYKNNIKCFPTFPSSLTYVLIVTNPFNCLPNYVLPAMNNYTTTPLCNAGNSNGCAAVGIKELNSNTSQINVFPNPSSGQFIIETFEKEKQTIQLFDLNGKLLFEQNINGKTNIDATNLNSGIYSLSIKTGDNIVNKKLVIVR